MIGNRDSLSAMIGSLVDSGKVRRRIFVHLLPLFLSFPRRINFCQMTLYGQHNEGTYHNWFKRELDVKSFNVSMVNEHGLGNHFVIFDPMCAAFQFKPDKCPEFHDAERLICHVVRFFYERT